MIKKLLLLLLTIAAFCYGVCFYSNDYPEGLPVQICRYNDLGVDTCWTDTVNHYSMCNGVYMIRKGNKWYPPLTTSKYLLLKIRK